MDDLLSLSGHNVLNHTGCLPRFATADKRLRIEGGNQCGAQ